ncbi:MAG: hypothetical protein R3D67_19150 [Hyphomicrobiaceae bacterium]
MRKTHIIEICVRAQRWACRVRALAAMAALLFVVLVPPVQAREWLTMPYDCSVIRGRVVLRQSGLKHYRVYAKREERSISLCATRAANSGRCRPIAIHRFDFDCGGERTSWIKAAATALHGLQWRASLNGNRLRLHPPSRRGSTYRSPLRALPVGFAPAPAEGVSFVVSDHEPGPSRFAQLRQRPLPVSPGPPASPALPQPPAVAAARDAEQLSYAVHTPDAKPDAEEVDAAPKPPTEPDDEGAAARVLTATGSSAAAWKVAVTPEPDFAMRQSWQSALRPPGPAGMTMLLAFGGLLLSAGAVMARHRLVARMGESAPGSVELGSTPRHNDIPPPPKPKVATLQDRDNGTKDDLPTPPAEATASGNGNDAEMPGEGQFDAVDAVDPHQAPPAHAETVGEAHGATGHDSLQELQATAEALRGIVGQIVTDHVPDGPLRGLLIEELAIIGARLDGPELAIARVTGDEQAASAIYAQAVVDLERARTLALIEHDRAVAPRHDVDSVADSLDKACAFLGVNPNAEPAVVKKVVMALRQNWHPDLASDEADRQTREARIKQINAAWDLICER